MDQALLVFVTVAEKKSFTRAGEQLHMTQPAVSQYISSLESDLGTRLLERSNKYVRLNKAGEIVYHHAKEILDIYNRMHYLVDDLMHSASGPLTIGASYTFGEYLLPRFIAHLRQLYPQINPVITIGNTQQIGEAVLNHQLDIGVIEGDFDNAKLHIAPFAEDRMYIVCSPRHSLAGAPTVSPAELSKETWIIRETGSGTREATERLFNALNFSPERIMEFGSTQIIKESVEADLGLTLLSYWAIRREVAAGSLKILRPAGIPIVRKFSLVIPAAPFHRAATQVLINLFLSGEGLPDDGNIAN